ncbi:alpha/beta hydrolase [Tunturibacter empetritectus]|uniref:Alpha/beta hydrolase n=1 Tax=Tunturiibacter empetritectus TaxID=3069691 RepID=A0AAU7ZG78_9BACT
MKRLALRLIAITLSAASQLHAQNPVGSWQATLPDESQGLRIMLKIEKGETNSTIDSWKGTLYTINQADKTYPTTTLTITGALIKFTVDDYHVSYEGTISPDGNSIAGTFTQGKSQPLTFNRATEATAWPLDSTPHKVQFVPVEADVKLEVLDWGGTGRPLVLLSGLGNDAHVFDNFALKLTPNYHVYGITRRGFGASSVPPATVANYNADRLGDDVLAVISALKLNQPIVVGHSIAGEELSSIGSRHPEKVAALIYLDAAFPYAFYNHANTDLFLDMVDVRTQIDALQAGAVLEPKFVDNMLTSVAQLEKDLQKTKNDLAKMLPPYPPPPPPLGLAIMFGQQKYTQIPAPILSIVACPHAFGDNFHFHTTPEGKAAIIKEDEARCTAQADAFQSGVPSAHIVRLPNADHYVFKSNEADTLREMNAFIATLPGN